MRFFYIKDDNSLILLDDFQIEPGQTSTKMIPTFGGYAIHRGRPSPDTFRLTHSAPLPNVGGFHVVDENCRVYGCIALQATPGRSLVVIGEVTASWEVPDKAAVQKVIAATK